MEMGLCGSAFDFIQCDVHRCSRYQICGNDYSLFRYRVISRDGFKCTKCGSKKNLHVHHVQRRKVSPELVYDPDNCVTLCAKCHEDEHREAQQRYDDWVYDFYDNSPYNESYSGGDEFILCEECGVNYHHPKYNRCYECHTDGRC